MMVCYLNISNCCSLSDSLGGRKEGLPWGYDNLLACILQVVRRRTAIQWGGRGKSCRLEGKKRFLLQGPDIWILLAHTSWRCAHAECRWQYWVMINKAKPLETKDSLVQYQKGCRSQHISQKLSINPAYVMAQIWKFFLLRWSCLSPKLRKLQSNFLFHSVNCRNSGPIHRVWLEGYEK